jgi:murein DD-endopeptidase MepM/ murein hydrolase activator NlpD
MFISRVALALACCTALPCVAAGLLPVTVDVRARALAPGEPIRIDVISDKPLVRLGGRFLDTPLFFVSVGDGRRWSGWSMIPLDREPGPAVVEVSGLGEGDRSAAGTRAVTIEARRFPEEQLSVAPKYVEPPPEVRERLAREREAIKALYASRRPVVPSNDVFLRPVPGGPTSVFGTRRLYNGKPRAPHPGLDLRAASGTSVISSGAGRVGLARDLYYSGNTVIVDHGGGLFTLYAHLSEIRVSEGDAVDAGQEVGLSGATGRVTGPHLHWGAKIGDLPFDPTALLDPDLF